MTYAFLSVYQHIVIIYLIYFLFFLTSFLGMFLGCHVGSVDDLEQMKIVTNDKKLTIDICLQHCQKKGLKFAAIEEG